MKEEAKEKEEATNSRPGKVFILSIKDAEILFLPDANEIVSVLRPNPVTTAAVCEGGNPPREESSRGL